MTDLNTNRDSYKDSIPANIGSRLGEAKNIGDFLSLWLKNNFLEHQHQKALDAYYVSYRHSFGSRMRDAYSEQIKEALEYVQSNPGAKVLEMGCGLGTESLWLAMHGASVLALDVVSAYVEVARKRKEILEQHLGRALNCEFRRASVVSVKEEQRFDLIWMEQAFQHLEPRDAVVEKTAKLTMPGGHIIISEINALNLFMQIQLFFVRGTRMYWTHVDEDGKKTVMGNERILTARSLKRLFERQGINCKSIRFLINWVA
jgi:2-polyprenyl-3-methyl-5-hydroxy-6-metoxy-1,4-benzoquinol methylase